VRRIAVLSLLAVFLAPMRAPCDTRSVYGPEVPGNSAFVRMVNAIPGPSQLRLELGATRFDPLPYAGVSPYKPVVPDIYQLEAGGSAQEIIPKSGAYYTVVCGQKAITVLQDPAHADPARAQLFLYNLSSLPAVDLKTSDGKTAVILGVAPNASGMKVVNAVTVSFAVFHASARIGTVGDLGLARGSSFSVFVLGGASPKVFAVKAKVAAE
jgi:alginate O-acetyltransferase complex protein AlgF